MEELKSGQGRLETKEDIQWMMFNFSDSHLEFILTMFRFQIG